MNSHHQKLQMTHLQKGAILPERNIPPIRLPRMVRFAGASGDFNPIHYDSHFAKLSQIERPVVQGAMIVEYGTAYLEELFGLKAVRKLSARFKKPVLEGDSLILKGIVTEVRDGGLIKIRLSVYNQDNDETAQIMITVESFDPNPPAAP